MNAMKCQICNELMDIDETGIFSVKYALGGHIGCMRMFVLKREKETVRGKD